MNLKTDLTIQLIRKISISIIVSMATMSGCKNVEMVSSWTKTPIVVDGHFADWEKLPVQVFEEEGVVVGISNDSNLLYLHYRTHDQKKAMAIATHGLTVYFDPSGGSSEDIYFRLRAGHRMRMKNQDRPEGEMAGRKPPAEGDRPDMMPSEGPGGPKFVYFSKRLMMSENPVETSGTNGPAAAFDTSYGFYSYEFSMPLTQFAPGIFSLGVSPGQTIAIGLDWSFNRGSFARDEEGGGRGHRGGISVGGLPGGGPGGDGMPGSDPEEGGMPGGGMGGGRPGGGPPRGAIGDQGSGKQKVWIKVHLAQMPS
jgi:hypothetical protein